MNIYKSQIQNGFELVKMSKEKSFSLLVWSEQDLEMNCEFKSNS